MHTPHIQNLGQYPDLYRAYQQAVRQAQIGGCGECDLNKIARKFTEQLHRRQSLTVAPITRPR